MVSMNCDNIDPAENLRFGSTNLIAIGRTFLRTSMSCSIIFSIPGRFTFTITSWSLIFARYTWPKEAPEIALVLIELNLSRFPRSLSSMGLIFSNDSAGTSSCNFDNSSRYGCGKRSAREESHCPSLMYTGPSEMNVLSILFAFLRNFFWSMSFPSDLTHCLLSFLNAIIIGTNLTRTRIVLILLILFPFSNFC